MDQPQKPTSVTVIGILIIILAVFGAIGGVSMMALKDDPAMAEALKANPLDVETLISISLGGAVVMLVSGIGVLLGANWGRWLYVIYSIAGIAFGAFFSPNLLQVLPSVALLAIFSFFLFRPAANEYFNRARG